MNRNRAKELLPIIQAFAEGKTIQFALEGHMWTDMHEETAFTFPSDDYGYRIKPEPREFWIRIGSHGTVIHHCGWLAEGEDFKPEKNGSLEMIKVREVIE